VSKLFSVVLSGVLEFKTVGLASSLDVYNTTININKRAMMTHKIMFLALALILSACSTTAPPEVLKSLYEVENAARQVSPQGDVALLYVLADDDADRTRAAAAMRIDGNLAFDGDLINKFYVFCLPEGNYQAEYIGDFFIKNKQEFIQVKKGGIYARQFNQSFLAISPFIFLAGSKLDQVSLEQLKKMVAVRRIGTDEIYGSSEYTCRSLS